MGRRIKPYLIENLEVTAALHDGKALGRDGEMVIFVEGAVPGDIVDAWVYRKQKRYRIANVQKLVKPSPHRVKPTCQHHDDCGGCRWQHMDQEGQMEFKTDEVKSAFQRIAGVTAGEWKPIMPGHTPLWYRNKTEYSFSCKPWIPKALAATEEKAPHTDVLGYHVAVVFDKILEVEKCWLHKPIVNNIRNELAEFSRQKEYTFYDHRMHTGFLRNVVFRTSDLTGEILMMLIVRDDEPDKIETIFKHLEAKFPEITTFLWIVNERLNSSYIGLEVRHWKGDPYITEGLGKWKFRIQPTSFFQTNTQQAVRLYEVVRQMIGGKVKTLYDLYCGAGSIGIYVSDHAEKIVGIEYVDTAIADAHVNVELNELDPDRFSFHAGNMKEVLDEKLFEKEGKPDIIITDPPRAGMDEPVVRQLLKVRAPRIIYVSCKPTTQARDLAILSEAYDVKIVQPVDMFPQTGHVENVVLLELREETAGQEEE